MRVYHFLPWGYARRDLKSRRLKIAEYEDPNDPFEMYAFDLSSTLLRNGTSSGREAMNRRFGMLCFSREWCNPLLWSHYADRHRGICLGFDVSDEIAREIVYEDNRLGWPLQASGVPQDVSEEQVTQLYTKYAGWRYEQEVRVYARLEDRDGRTRLFFADLGPQLVLREVILGPRCTAKVTELRKLVRGWRPTVAAFRAGLAVDAFRIIRAMTRGVRVTFEPPNRHPTAAQRRSG